MAFSLIELKEKVLEIIPKLLAKKEQCGKYNVAVRYKGLTWLTSLEPEKDKDFEDMQVTISVRQGKRIIPIIFVNPVKVGYKKYEYDLYKRSLFKG